MRPEIAAKVAASAGNFTGSKGADQLMDAKLKAQFAKSFPEEALKNVKWYPQCRRASRTSKAKCSIA